MAQTNGAPPLYLGNNDAVGHKQALFHANFLGPFVPASWEGIRLPINNTLQQAHVIH